MSMIDKVKSRVGKIRGQGILRQKLGKGQMKLGSGSIMAKAKTRVDRVTAKIKERKPGLVAKVKEFKPGGKIKELLSAAVVDRTGKERDMSVSSDRPPHPYNSRNLSVEW